MRFFVKKDSAFTLAEVLITMTIIGVIAAMVLPLLKNAVPDKDITMYRKAHSIFEQTIQTMTNGSDFTEGNLALPVDATNANFCKVFSETVNLLGTASCTAVSTTAASPSFTTADGVAWYLTQNYDHPVDTSTATGATKLPYDSDKTTTEGDGTYYTHVVVDVNGPDTLPNCGAKLQAAFAEDDSATCLRPDRYMMGVRYDGKISVYGDTARAILKSSAKRFADLKK